MLRTHHCGELRAAHIGQKVNLCGWVSKVRDKGFVLWIDLRDRYGITQLVLNEEVSDEASLKTARSLGREFVLSVQGEVIERESKNDKIPSGEVEIRVEAIEILNASKLPPFTIENDTDGGEDLRMQYRYLDIRRDSVKEKLILRHKVAQLVRNYLSNEAFIEVETPVLIKSTPEGARDFVVPSRLNENEWYALPQSPQTFKQLLMVGGMDKYFQIVKCFRDEDLRADRQPEFTQIDCEMSFVEREDILAIFEGMAKYILKEAKGLDMPAFDRMTYADAMNLYGSDKPDTRFGMSFNYITEEAQGKGFGIFDSAESVIAINVKDGNSYTRKEIDKLTDFVKSQQVGAKGLIYCRCNEDGSFKSSVDKFYDQVALGQWASVCGAEANDIIFVLSGDKATTQSQMSELRLHIGEQRGLRNPDEYKALWVLDFPLLEYDIDSQRYHAMHHPFTAPLEQDLDKMESAPGEVRANAYDMVINGVEIGGGSIRIFDKDLQSKMFSLLGLSEEDAQAQFGFLMQAFEYGAPPHGGIALGFDRLCSLIGGTSSIRDYIAFPKNNSGRDVMIDAPAPLNADQLKDLNIG
ncbi:MAG: aspartate--tRNA ligase [Bacteroidia bacterium]|nr:aspartate--tRNA ligase [Bacteroidia bacterium]